MPAFVALLLVLIVPPSWAAASTDDSDDTDTPFWQKLEQSYVDGQMLERSERQQTSTLECSGIDEVTYTFLNRPRSIPLAGGLKPGMIIKLTGYKPLDTPVTGQSESYRFRRVFVNLMASDQTDILLHVDARFFTDNMNKAPEIFLDAYASGRWIEHQIYPNPLSEDDIFSFKIKVTVSSYEVFANDRFMGSYAHRLPLSRAGFLMVSQEAVRTKVEIFMV